MSHHKVEVEFAGRKITLESGLIAKQAGGSVTVRCGDSIVLVTACGAKEARPGADFFPLTVDYIEKTFAAGKIPGGFFKREGRPSEQAVLTSRLIDRPLRPLFPEGYLNETQIIATVLSADSENDTDVLAMIGASAALSISPMPFLGPIAGVSVGRVNGQFVCNPTPSQMDESDLDLMVAGSRDAIVMVEGGARELSEDTMLEAILFAHREMQVLLDAQEKLRGLCGKPKWEVVPPEKDETLETKVRELVGGRINEAITISDKLERYATLDAIKAEVKSKLVPENDETGLSGKISEIYSELKSNVMRSMVIETRKRIDGRDLTTVRPIAIQNDLLPRTHGSSLFTRGETQALVITTLGTSDDQQRIDDIQGEYFKRFTLHYNFPPFCVGEVKFLRSPGRREIGHGALAERALYSVIPDEETFPYTIRLVSEIMESNGSSSMASVCGGSLALMDAGVPITAPVAGVAMGLIKEGDKYAILTDILGDEDHLGDMDFKVAGTSNGVTALQMDIKISGLTESILKEALKQAQDARMHILGEMAKSLTTHRVELSQYAPKISSVTIAKDKIGLLIGPGGKTIRSIQEETGAKINIDEDGTVHIYAVDQTSGDHAVKMVRALTASPEVGEYYRGVVQKVVDFGAFVQILPGTDGLVHVSQLAEERVNAVGDILKEGDELIVKVLEVDGKSGKIRLSRKDALGYSGELANS